MQYLIILMCLFTIRTYAQNMEIEGEAKVTIMNPATSSAQPVAREPDGTLSLMQSTTTTYEVGDFAQGGVVFWLRPDGKSGKVVSIYNAGSMSWSNITTSIGSPAESNINGAGNTVAITLQDGHERSAALHCSQLAYGSYDDWYLPSSDELNHVYMNSAAIDSSAMANGGEFFESTWYWSSTESDASVNVIVQNFGDGTQGNFSKNQIINVRAVRAF